MQGFEGFDVTTVLSVVAVVLAMVMIRFMPRLVAGVPFVSPGDLKAGLDRGDEMLVVDVRTSEEFTGQLGHVPGSINLPLANLDSRISSLGDQVAAYKSAPVFLVCRTSNRAANAARIMARSGFKNIKVMDGGMAKWNRQGLPTTKTR